MGLIIDSYRFGAFTPLSLPGLEGWYDASDAANRSLTVAVIDSLTDKSGNSRTATSSGSPTLLTADQNGLDTAYFNNSLSQYFNITANAGMANIFAGGGSLIGVFNTDSMGTGGEGRLINNDASPSGGFNFLNLDEVSGSCKLRLEQYWDGAVYAKWTTTNRDFSLTGYHIVEITYNSSSASNDPTIYIDNTSSSITEDTTPSGAVVDDSSSDMRFGGGGNHFNGKIGELLFLSTALDATTRAQITQFLSSKWNITIA